MNSETVNKITKVVGGVLTEAQNVLALLAEAGVGNHLNEEQAANVLGAIKSLGMAGLNAYHAAHDIEITPDSILALLPEEIVLKNFEPPVPPVLPPSEPVQPPTPTVESSATPSASDLDKVSEEQKAADATSGTSTSAPVV